MIMTTNTTTRSGVEDQQPKITIVATVEEVIIINNLHFYSAFPLDSSDCISKLLNVQQIAQQESRGAAASEEKQEHVLKEKSDNQEG
ncbi:hypothetical protein Y1Q_0015912 [Alligator mississippiensis]|uniref:Uncharacterized protein n=1 Tax=Alligator mississippiensis TaxID=8496 RepID=A0A151MHE4_ALLMI|nr:hypothetical protein Y1Q_0015912 [Alligator mississippiensis]